MSPRAYVASAGTDTMSEPIHADRLGFDQAELDGEKRVSALAERSREIGELNLQFD